MSENPKEHLPAEQFPGVPAHTVKRGLDHLIDIPAPEYTPATGKDEWAPVFLRHYAYTQNQSLSCARTGITKHRLTSLIRRDPAFVAAMEESRSALVAALEGEAFVRALEGVAEPVYHQGVLCGFKRKYDNRLLLRVLAKLDPSWRETTEDATKQITAEEIADAVEDMLGSIPTEGPAPEPEFPDGEDADFEVTDGDS